ncbi:hypothetical protein Ccrd_005617 [Cynara cardunculus var. scolymus]|uniref:Uncharacterized protein n=1 Tax=Cynara cardunculus var. scolymus TaxID=59895 RepID=A0A103XKD7_CYNCS|nr:hypothetical protein Ccrd_005617 [Cynara cardunculus var. scolymus]
MTSNPRTELLLGTDPFSLITLRLPPLSNKIDASHPSIVKMESEQGSSHARLVGNCSCNDGVNDVVGLWARLIIELWVQRGNNTTRGGRGGRQQSNRNSRGGRGSRGGRSGNHQQRQQPQWGPPPPWASYPWAPPPWSNIGFHKQ